MRSLVKKQKLYVIAGAGYAGRMAAARLSQRHPEARIVVVDPLGQVIERARLHEVVGGWHTWRRPMQAILPKGGEHLRGWVKEIDTAHRRVTVESAEGLLRLDADGIIVALGSRTQSIPAEGASIPVLDVEDTAILELRQQRFSPDAPLAIVGTGLTGIEIASVLAENQGKDRVILIGQEEPGLSLAPAAKAYLQRYLEKTGIRFLKGRALSVEGDQLCMADGTKLRVGGVIGCAGFHYPPFARQMGWPVDASGRVLVEISLALPQTEGIFIAGDMAACLQRPDDPRSSYRPACATAMPMGVHAAEQLLRKERDLAALPFSFAYMVQCLALGRRDGILQFVDATDQAKPSFWTGRRAVWVKEMILALTWHLPALEMRLRWPLYRWLTYHPKDTHGQRDAKAL